MMWEAPRLRPSPERALAGRRPPIAPMPLYVTICAESLGFAPPINTLSLSVFPPRPFYEIYDKKTTSCWVRRSKTAALPSTPVLDSSKASGGSAHEEMCAPQGGAVDTRVLCTLPLAAQRAPAAPPEPRRGPPEPCTQARRLSRANQGVTFELASAHGRHSAVALARRSPPQWLPGLPSGDGARCWRCTPSTPSSPGARRAPGTRRRAAGEPPCSADGTCVGRGGAQSAG
jgi:hypothetical protein